MKRISSYLLLLAAAVFTACEASDDWQPGPEVAEGTPVVYFSSENPAVIGHIGDDAAAFKLTLERTDTVGEMTVPIVVTDSVGSMEVPATVTFADGDDQADILIRYTYQPGMMLALSLGEGYGNPYLEVDGTMSYKCNVARLLPFCKVNYDEDCNLSGVESEIYRFEGMNRFRFTNFLASGVDVTFTVNTSHNSDGSKFDPENLRALYGGFVPVDNNYYYDGGWYLYDSNNDEYPSWTPPGWDIKITYFYFFNYQQGGWYAYIDFRKPSGSNKRNCYFFNTYVYYGDGDDYLTSTFNYTLDFEEDAPKEEQD